MHSFEPQDEQGLSVQMSSLIISTRNRHRMLIETIASVLEGEYVPSELIVVDHSDCPDEEIAQLKTARPCEIRYIWKRESGLCRARNTGIAAASHDVIAIVDDDMFVDRSWYGSLMSELMRSGPRTVVTGRVLAAQAQSTTGFAPSLVTSELPAMYEGRIGTDVLAGGNMALFRSAFDEIGYFDERLGAGSRLPAADDNDFGFRLLESGYRIVYKPEAVVYHRAWRKGSDFVPLRWSYGRGKGGFYLKHLKWTDRYMLHRAARDIYRRLLFSLPRLFYNRRRVIGDFAYIAGILWGGGVWVFSDRKRHATGPDISRGSRTGSGALTS